MTAKREYADPDNGLPINFQRRESKGAGRFFMVLSSLFAGIPLLFAAHSVFSGEFELSSLFPLILIVIIGAGLFLFGLTLFVRELWVYLDKERATVRSKTLFGVREWSEPIANYNGVLCHSTHYSHTSMGAGGTRSIGRSYTNYIIDLSHDDCKKTIALYKSKSESGIRQLWENLCRLLELPALEFSGNEIRKRRHQDLDKSIKELAEDGKIDIHFDPQSPPPSRIAIEYNEDCLDIIIQPLSIKSIIWRTIGGLIFCGIPVFIGFYVDAAAVLLGYVGIALSLFVLWALFWSLLVKNGLRISKNEIGEFQLAPWGKTYKAAIPVKDVEEIKAAAPLSLGSDNSSTKCLMIVSDDLTIEFAVGLPLTSQEWEWLERFVLAVTVRNKQ